MALMRDERGARQGVAKQKGYKTRPAVRLEYCVKRRLLMEAGQCAGSALCYRASTRETVEQ